jgi:hypothetical protein
MTDQEYTDAVNNLESALADIVEKPEGSWRDAKEKLTQRLSEAGLANLEELAEWFCSA